MLCKILRSSFSTKARRTIFAMLKTHRIESEHYPTIFTPELQKLIDLFKKYDYELRIAGGAVRDLLCDIPPHDIDFATTATPSEMKNMFEKENIRMLNNRGESHGTITCRIDDKENFEVTTLRIDVITDGRRAQVEYTKNWELDALRRDLTVNSLFLDFDGLIYDYFNGVSDLRNRIVRFVGAPEDRIQEDYLRILRYFRFYGRISPLENNHEKETLEAIKANRQGLSGVAGERLWVEMKKIVTGNHSAAIWKCMLECQLGQHLGLNDVSSNTEQLRVVHARATPLKPLPVVVMAALLDSVEHAHQLHQRVKLSREELGVLTFIIEHRHDEDFKSRPFAHCCDLHFDHIQKVQKIRQRIEELLKYLGLGEVLERFAAYEPPVFPINGVELLEAGVPKGPAVAKILGALRREWKEGGYQGTKEELLKRTEDLKLNIVQN